MIATVIVIAALSGNATAAASWVPASLVARVSAAPATATDDSIKNILIPDYETRIDDLDTGVAFIKRHIIQLRDNVLMLYQQYNRGYSYDYDFRTFNAVLEDMGFYLPRLESKVNPDNDLPLRMMRKPYLGGDNKIGCYWVMIPRGYTSDKAYPLISTDQMQMSFIDKFMRVVTNSGYIAVGENASLTDVAHDLHIDPFRTYTGGFSQGGHTSMRSAWWRPDRYAACVPVSPDLRLPNQASYFYCVKALKNVPVRILQGDYDGYIDGTKYVYEVMQEAGCPVEFMTFLGAHEPIPWIDPASFPLITTFFDQHVLNPYPKTVYHAVEAGQVAYSRAFWVDGKLARNQVIGGFNPTYTVTADKAANTITIDSADAIFTSFDFYLCDSLVDMTSPVNVVKNGTSLFFGAVPTNGKLTVLISTQYTIPATATTKASIITSQQLTGGVTRNQWQELDSIRCLIFNDCSDTLPSTAVKKAEKPLPGNAGITVSPNPFNPRTVISIKNLVPSSKKNEIQIFNIHGKLIQTLSAPSLVLGAGLSWDASAQPSGIYIVKAVVGGQVLAKQMTLIK